MKFLKEIIRKKADVELNADPGLDELEPLQRKGPRAMADNVTHISEAQDLVEDPHPEDELSRDDEILAALNADTDEDEVSVRLEDYQPDPLENPVLDEVAAYDPPQDDAFDHPPMDDMADDLDLPSTGFEVDAPEFDAPDVAPPADPVQPFAEDEAAAETPEQTLRNIWDLESDETDLAEDEDDPWQEDEDEFDVPMPEPEASNIVEVPAPAVGRAGRRAGRVKTRFLGFEAASDAAADPFAQPAADNQRVEAHFPVGWIVVVKGPGLGASFTLFNGVSQIGRGDEQAVRLDFGDNSISRENHAAIAYDSEQRTFFLGHGGKANIVRLNDRPVLSTEELSNADIIRIGETSLRFIALCGAGFDWEELHREDSDDAAIA